MLCSLIAGAVGATSLRPKLEEFAADEGLQV